MNDIDGEVDDIGEKGIATTPENGITTSKKVSEENDENNDEND